MKDFFYFLKNYLKILKEKIKFERFEDAINKLKDIKDFFGKNLLNIESIFLDKNYENTFKDIKQRIGKNTLIFLVILQSFSIFQHNKMYKNIDKLLLIKIYI